MLWPLYARVCLRLPADIEENGVRLRLTVVDTPGFGDFVNNDEWYVNFRHVCCAGSQRP